MTTAVRSNSPGRDKMSPAMRTAIDWLAANGIDEWLPEEPVIGVADGHISYLGWKFDGPRGYDAQRLHVEPNADEFSREARTVPMVAPLTDEVRAAFRKLETGDVKERGRLVEA